MRASSAPRLFPLSLALAVVAGACSDHHSTTGPQVAGAAAAVVSPRNVKVTWTPLDGYDVAIERAAKGEDFAEVARKAGDHARFLDLALQPNTEYRYRLRACSGDTCGDAAQLDPVTTPASPIPGFTLDPGSVTTDDVLIFGIFSSAFDPLSPGQAIAVDRAGTILWELDSPQGILFEIQQLADGTLVFEQGGDLLWLDLDQSVRLHYTGSIVHHDIDQLSDGRFIYLGYDIFEEPPGYAILGDTIEILREDGSVVDWSWRGRDHIPLSDTCPADMNVLLWGLGHDWTHFNAVIFDEPNNRIYLNVRNLDRFYAIDYPSGDVAWVMGEGGDFGAGIWDHCHDPTFTAPNRILMLDNGSQRPGAKYSRVIEVEFDPDAKTADVVWEYRETPDFYSAFLGSVNLQDNGDVLVTDGTNGRIFQVTRDKQRVWQLQLDGGYFSYKTVVVPRTFFTDW